MRVAQEQASGSEARIPQRSSSGAAKPKLATLSRASHLKFGARTALYSGAPRFLGVWLRSDLVFGCAGEWPAPTRVDRPCLMSGCRVFGVVPVILRPRDLPRSPVVDTGA